MVANHTPTSIEIWDQSQDLMRAGHSERALTLHAAERLAGVCHSYVAKMARLYLMDIFGSFRKSISSIGDSDVDSQKIIMALGARWALMDRDVAKIFVDAGVSKEFRMNDLLDGLVQHIGSDSQKLILNIWSNVTNNIDNSQYFVNNIPEFISKYDESCSNLVEVLSDLD